MAPQTLKMIMMFFLAAALLNMTNYLFYYFYDPPSRNAIKVSFSLKIPELINLSTETRVTRSVEWTKFLVCDKQNSTNISAKDGETSVSSVSTDIQLDYREQSTETSGFYYYNGIRKGPVMCPILPPGLGPIDLDVIDLNVIENLYTVLQPGGVYEKFNCVPRQTVAIIVPFMGEKNQLTEFLYALHPMLMKQQLEYQIFVVKAENKSIPLNRGELLNIGFTEAQRMKKNGGWRCVIFHHHDIVPTDSRNLYLCNKQPAQFVTSLTNNITYQFPFGGAISMKPAHFLKVNGFSNLYSGNDAMYDDLMRRLINANFTMFRKNDSISVYKPLFTPQDNYNESDYKPIPTTSPLHLLDGLSTLTYGLVEIDLKPLYTQITAILDYKPSDEGDAIGQSHGDVSSKLWDRLLNQATSSQKTSSSSQP